MQFLQRSACDNQRLDFRERSVLDGVFCPVPWSALNRFCICCLSGSLVGMPWSRSFGILSFVLQLLTLERFSVLPEIGHLFERPSFDLVAHNA